MIRSLTIRPALGLLTFLVGWPVLAPSARAENIEVTVLAIVATDRDNKIDQEIKCIADEVRKKHPTWTGFRLERTTRRSIQVGGEETFPLIDGKEATVAVKSGLGKDNKVSLKVTAPDMGGIIYAVCCGKCLPLKTPYVTRDERRLFIAVLVKPCNKGKP